MKTIGLIGGITWHSTLDYYKMINELVHEKLGGDHAAQCLLYSFDWDTIAKLQNANDWAGLEKEMIFAAQKLKSCGADFLVICANTMHKCADAIQKSTGLPLIHIADATAQAIKAKGFKKIGLLGTKFTMEEDFLKGRLSKNHKLDVIVPDAAGRETINKILYTELARGIIKDESRKKYVAIINNLIKNGAQGIILGCTEIPMLISQKDVSVPVFDTTQIHARAIVDFALK